MIFIFDRYRACICVYQEGLFDTHRYRYHKRILQNTTKYCIIPLGENIPHFWGKSDPSPHQGHFGTWPVWQGHRRDGSIVTRLKPGHTRNMALGCSTITPTGYARPRLSTERRKRRLSPFFRRKTLTVTEKRKRPATGLNVFQNTGEKKDLLRIRALQ